MAENEEDWFYESISRYKNLNMFELEYPIDHVEPINSNSICVSCSNKKRHQLLELALPLKLVSQPNDSSEVVITNDTDLKIKCGTFTQSRILHMKTVGDLNVVASHLNTRSITLYQLSSDDSDEIKKESFLKCELESPSLAVSDGNLVLAKSNVCPTLVMDISTGQITGRVPADTSPESCGEPVSPVYVEPRLVALCHHASGRVLLYDSRDCKLLNNINIAAEKNNHLWTFASLYECSEKSTGGIQSTCVASLSDNGTLKVYDSRNWTSPCIDTKLEIKPSNSSSVQLRFKPSQQSWVSVSGFDGNVYVYRVVSDPELVFVHDGHKHVEGHSPNTVTSSHVWSTSIDNLVISSAQNGTIQSWQFENKINSRS